MPVWRSNLSQTSMYAKFLTYFHGHQAGFHTRTYGITNFRVLTCSTTAERTANMIAMIKKHVAPSNMFLFTHSAALQSASDVLSLAWTSGKDQPVRLID